MSERQPKWLTFRGVVGIHHRILAEHGGQAGLHDAGLLESALGRPINRFMYESANIPRQAADYAYSLAMNHPFKERNELTAFVSAFAFLRMNGFDFTAPPADVVSKIKGLRMGELTEERLVDWIAEFSNPLE